MFILFWGYCCSNNREKLYSGLILCTLDGNNNPVLPSSTTRPWACPDCRHALSPAEGSVSQELTGTRLRAACSGKLCTSAGWDSARPERTRRGREPLCSRRCWSQSHSASWTLFSPGVRRWPGARTAEVEVRWNTKKKCASVFSAFLVINAPATFNHLTLFGCISPLSIIIQLFNHMTFIELF